MKRTKIIISSAHRVTNEILVEKDGKDHVNIRFAHSARTLPAVHSGITIWVDNIEIEKKRQTIWPGDFFGGGSRF